MTSSSDFTNSPTFHMPFAFMTAAALHIQALDHHPEWCNVYGKVTVHLVTHAVNGISSADVELATLLESLASKLQ